MKNMIQQNIIDNLPVISADGFSDDENRYVNEWIKYALQYAMNGNNSNEVGAMLDKTDWTKYDIVLGTEQHVRFNTKRMLEWQDTGNNNLILIHNHPSDSIFSDRDIFNFCKTQAVNILIVVGNRGTIYLLQKLDKFNKYELIRYYSDRMEKDKNIFSRQQILENMLQSCQKELGIRFEKEEIV